MKTIKTSRFITEKELLDSANGKSIESKLVVITPQGEKTDLLAQFKKTPSFREW